MLKKLIESVLEKKSDLMPKGKSTWHIISNEGVSLAILGSEKDAKLYRSKAAFGYYKNTKIEEVTDNYDHWSKFIKTPPKDPTGLWL